MDREGIPARVALEIAVRHGAVIVNTLAHWGGSRMPRACRRAVKKGWLRPAGGKPDRFRLEPTEAGRAALAEPDGREATDEA